MAERDQQGGLRIHLGCGPTVVAGWENVDKSPSVILARTPRLRRLLLRLRLLDQQQAAGFPPGVRRADISRTIPYPDGSAGYVYAGHVIEHLSRWQAVEMLAECMRVLACGGVLRLATPDLHVLADRYLTDTLERGDDPTNADAFMRHLGTFAEADGNRGYRALKRLLSGSAHQWLYDSESLLYLLREVGFADGQTSTYLQGGFPDLAQLERRPDSLFVEAIRP